MNKIEQTAQMEPGAVLWLAMGKALWFLQSFEHVIAMMVVRTKQRGGQRPTYKQAYRELEKNFGETLGTLVGAMRERQVLPPEVEQRCSALVKERNWLAHHFWRKHHREPRDLEETLGLVRRLEALWNEAIALSKAFEEMAGRWAAANGVTPEELEREAARQYEAGLIDGFPAPPEE